MISPSLDVEIPLIVHNAHRTIPFRRPTVGELETLEFHPLTSDAEWRPHEHNDCCNKFLPADALLPAQEMLLLLWIMQMTQKM